MGVQIPPDPPPSNLKSIGEIKMFAFLATWWFWITLIIVIDLFICEATDSPIIGVFSLVAAAFAYQFLGGVDLWGYVIGNPLNVLVYLGGYFVVGLGWCVLKWVLYSLDIRTKYREFRQNFCDSNGLHKDDVVPATLFTKWQKAEQHFKDTTFGYYGRNRSIPPKSKEHKRRIIRWIAYWPISVLWSIFSDFIERIARAIYDFVSGFLQNITDKLFEGEVVEVEIPNPPDEDDDVKGHPPVWGSSAK